MITIKTQLKVWLAIMGHAKDGCQKCRNIIDDVAVNVNDKCLKEMGII